LDYKDGAERGGHELEILARVALDGALDGDARDRSHTFSPVGWGRDGRGGNSALVLTPQSFEGGPEGGGFAAVKMVDQDGQVGVPAGGDAYHRVAVEQAAVDEGEHLIATWESSKVTSDGPFAPPCHVIARTVGGSKRVTS
jgi:hypothetical protein